MIPLRLEVEERTALKIQEAPQALKDEIEERHKLLLDQVRHLYTEKQHELEAYVDRRVHEWETSQAKEALANEQAMMPSPRIKSIVKRQPSTSEKRVSFGNSPPRVELFRKDYYDEDDEDDRKPPVVAPNGEAVNFRSQPLYPFPQPDKGNQNRGVEMNEEEVKDEKQQTSETRNGGEKEDDRHSSSAILSSPSESEASLPNSPAHRKSADSPIKHHQSHTDQQPQTQQSSSYRPPTSPEMFPFELEPPTLPDDEDATVNEHHAPFDSPYDNAPLDSSLESPDVSLGSPSEGPVPLYDDLPEDDDMVVGSAPIDIMHRNRSLEGDGGPIARSEDERLKQEAEDRDLGISFDRDLPDPSQLDPSQMSFSQRMEWENLTSLKNSKRA